MPGRRRLKRALVIEKAAEMADEAGNAGAVTLSALAAALEVRPPSLYNHVASLDDLQAAMAVFALRQLLEDLRQALSGLVGRAAIMSIANAYRRFVHAHPGIYPLTIRAPGPEEPERTALSHELVHMMLLVMASLGLQGDDAIHAIRGLRAILHGFTSLERAGGYEMDVDREESFRRLIDAFLGGIK